MSWTSYSRKKPSRWKNVNTHTYRHTDTRKLHIVFENKTRLANAFGFEGCTAKDVTSSVVRKFYNSTASLVANNHHILTISTSRAVETNFFDGTHVHYSNFLQGLHILNRVLTTVLRSLCHRKMCEYQCSCMVIKNRKIGFFGKIFSFFFL